MRLVGKEPVHDAYSLVDDRLVLHIAKLGSLEEDVNCFRAVPSESVAWQKDRVHIQRLSLNGLDE